jgi:hypothetical protein
VIEALFHDRLAEHYSVLVYHYSRSGNTAQTLDYLRRAGQQTMERSAHVEAPGYLTQGLKLLPLPERVPARSGARTALAEVGTGRAGARR